MRVFITGSTGVVGSSLCYWVHKNSDYDIYAQKQESNNSFLLENIRYRALSLLDCDLIPEQIDVVIHTARSMKKSEMDRINIHGTVNLLKQAKKRGCKLFIFISSTVVYAKTKETIITEETSIVSRNKCDQYTLNKIEGEELVRNFCELENMKYIILRLSYASGESIYGKYSMTLRAIKNIARYGFCFNTTINMIHIQDISAIIFAIISNQETPSGTYNLTGVPIHIPNIFKNTHILPKLALDKILPTSSYFIFNGAHFDNSKLLKQINYNLRYTAEHTVFSRLN